MRFRFTSSARNDLHDIANYTLERWGEIQCDRYLTGLQSRCQQLALEPGLRQQHPDVPSYFRAIAGRHAIFYRVEDDGTILVIRILHAAMLPELHLPRISDDDDELGE